MALTGRFQARPSHSIGHLAKEGKCRNIWLSVVKNGLLLRPNGQCRVWVNARW